MKLKAIIKTLEDQSASEASAIAEVLRDTEADAESAAGIAAEFVGWGRFVLEKLKPAPTRGGVFSAGPWSDGGESSFAGGCDEVHHADGEPVLHVEMWAGMDKATQATARANKRLAIAAPELYALVVEISEDPCGHPGSGDCFHTRACALVNRVKLPWGRTR